MNTDTIAKPLTLDKVDVSAEIYGVKVCWLGEDGGEQIMAFTHDPRRALAAAHALARRSDDVTDLALHEPKWVQVFDHCGCTEHELDDEEMHLCDCDRLGLPPCREEDYGWMAEDAAEDAPTALPVIVVDTLF